MQPTLKDWLNRTPKVPKSGLKRSGRLRGASKKRSRANREYYERRKRFLEAHPYCQAQERITAHLGHYWYMVLPSAEIHHTKKPKCKYLNDESTWLAVSFWAHRWIEDHKKTARQLGLLQ